MTAPEAYQILGLPIGSDFSEIKKKYRRLMLQVHPDTGSRTDAVLAARAQEINVAYSVLKRLACSGNSFVFQSNGGFAQEGYSSCGYQTKKKERSAWNAPINQYAYREREILHYAEDSEGMTLGSFRIAKGKYLWITEEDFPLFLLSVYRCGKEILDEIDFSRRQEPEPAVRQQIHAELVYLLAQQFIDGTALLRELAKRASGKTDSDVFYLPAMLENTGLYPVSYEEALFPSRLQKHRLYLKNSSGQELGYLSFPDDRLYYVVIPLFEQRRAQVRIQTAEQQSGWPAGGRRKKDAGAYRRLHLWIKLSSGEQNGLPENLNLQIEQLLKRYRQSL